ncbi:MAG TPA: undecaprenyl-diphosphate phosphatase [Virgibacillus sp.]|nr:undecaprenyl-diphosphate phosphatase [Virgibacillus sp.]
MDLITKLILLLKYAFLGLVQGFTEPLPISSSGHIVLIRHLFSVNIEGLSFEIIVNFGSLIAVTLVYRHDILRLIKNSLSFVLIRDRTNQADFKFCVLLIIATIPTGIIGLLFEDFISKKLSTVTVVGMTLLITGLALWIIRNLTGHKQDQQITIKDALIVGLAQSIALIPGISRSGATIVAAMLTGMKRETALRFSFLLYLPVSFGVTILSVGDIVNDKQFNLLAIPYTIALLASIITTFYALRWFMNIMIKGHLKYFTYYCFAIGLLVILFM